MKTDPKTGRHDIAEILLKVVLNTINKYNQTDFVFVGPPARIVFKIEIKIISLPAFHLLSLSVHHYVFVCTEHKNT